MHRKRSVKRTVARARLRARETVRISRMKLLDPCQATERRVRGPPRD